jgi:hypothetical protein
MVTFEHGQYSVPQRLLGEQVWARTHGLGAAEEVIIVHVDPQRGPVEVARHLRAVSGSPRIDDSHFDGPLIKLPGQYKIRPRTDAEEAFLAIGDGARVADRGCCRWNVADPGEDGGCGDHGQSRWERSGRLGIGACRGQWPVRLA